MVLVEPMESRVPEQSVRGGTRYYPAFINLAGRRVVVVGGGAIATGKVRGLLPCGPSSLMVIAPSVSPWIRTAVDEALLVWRPRSYLPGDLANAGYVFAATDDRALNAAVAAEARSRSVPVLAVDDVPNCDFIAPAVLERGSLAVAISTHGRSPAMARFAREALDILVPEHWGALLEIAATVRERLGPLRQRISADAWQAVLRDPEIEALARTGDLEPATERVLARLCAEIGA